MKIQKVNAGMALVITLALVVLVTAVVLAFFSRATANRLVESSRANNVKVEQLAQSSADYIVGSFLQEITSVTNSVVNTDPQSDWALYLPQGATNAMPARVLSDGVSKTDPNFYNLVRQSVPAADVNASTAGTGIPSKMGRVVGAERWNAPLLVGGAGFTTVAQLPHWIYVNQDGSVASTGSTNTIGRFAYNVYDLGGLLDANVAGHPSALSGTNLAAIKGRLSGADLSRIPGVINEDKFVEWRNVFTTTTGSGGYVTNTARAATNNFREALPGDNRFTSRQDLIKYARDYADAGINTNALPYLTTFSRTLNSPSYTPPILEAGIAPATPDLNKRYQFPRDLKPLSPPNASVSDDDINPSLLTIRVGTSPSWMREDGTQAEPGEPLLKKRFPLSRLAGIGRNGPVAPATAVTIKRQLGLVWDGSANRWIYTSPTNTTERTSLKTLAEVAAEGREPDFFELLQASIRVGSLGKAIGLTFQKFNDPPQALKYTTTYNQILQIGANLIDQYDDNSYPTRLAFNGQEFIGVENLPYLSGVFFNRYSFTAPVDDATRVKIGIYIQPQIWSLHQASVSSTGPTPSVRFVVRGNWRISPTGADAGNSGNGAPAAFPDQTGTFGASDVILLAATDSYRGAPMVPEPSSASVTDSENRVTDNGNDFLGIFVAELNVKPNNIITFTSKTGTISYVLQYQDGSNWYDYSTMDAYDGGFAIYDNVNPNAVGLYNPHQLLSKSDPRTQRFGYMQGQVPYIPTGNTLRPDYHVAGVTTYWFYGQNDLPEGKYPGVNFTNKGVPDGYYAPYPGMFTQNSPDASPSNRPSWYADPDGVNRRADGAYASGAFGQPLDLLNGNGGIMSRPVILNRPFQSVADMGYAFRDLPWKSLDFFTTASGDAALLDAFCVDENSPSALVGGKVNLNTRQAPVLESILAGAIKNESGSVSLNVNESGKIASRITGLTTTTPLVNRSELATKILPFLQSADFADAPADAAIKFRREAVTRALAEVGDTRTWNLLIDVIVQSGRFAPGGTFTESDFRVEGEKRVWRSIALDRYTGRVLEESVEVVTE